MGFAYFAGLVTDVFRREITFEMLRDEFHRSPAACAAWLSYCDDIRYSPAWAFGPSGSDGRFVAAYRHKRSSQEQTVLLRDSGGSVRSVSLGFVEQF